MPKIQTINIKKARSKNQKKPKKTKKNVETQGDMGTGSGEQT